MSTPYEPVLRHEGIDRRLLCPQCRDGILNTPCKDVECGCECTRLPLTPLPVTDDFAFPPQMTFAFDPPMGSPATNTANPPPVVELEPQFVEGKLVTDPAATATVMLIVGALIGGMLGVALAYPDVPTPARVIFAIMGVFTILFVAMTTVERKDNAGA